MGCSSSAGADVKAERPELSSNTPVCSGGDKDIFGGKFGGVEVVVAIVRQGRSDDRLLNEIAQFQACGKHPNIIAMVNSGKMEGRTYLVFETVKPIGYDLARLRNQYSFLSQAVPSALMARLMSNVADALNHMHSRGVIHKDVKADNVLVTREYYAKLIDMGIAQKKGPCEQLRAPYLAPELCKGGNLGPEVDCWGMGVIIHQVYQSGKWRLLSCGPNESVRMMNGMPCQKNPMEDPCKEAMLGLIKLSPAQRWTIAQFKAAAWVSGVAARTSVEWEPVQGMASQNTVEFTAKSKYIREWKSIEPPPPALAALLGKGQRHIIGKPIGGMGFHKKHNATVLLIDKGSHGGFVRVPGPNTTLDEGNWIYFGVNQTIDATTQEDNFDTVLDGLQKSFYGDTADGKTADGRGSEAGTFVAFTLEFDCFTFPEHVGKKAMIGRGSIEAPQAPGEDPALDLRANFHLNLMGIHRMGEEMPEWFPKATSTVRAGDIGLVVRQPEKSGASKSTVNDDDLEPLMNPARFAQIMAKSRGGENSVDQTFYGVRAKVGQEVLIKAEQGAKSVTAYKSPDSKEPLGDIPAGERVIFCDEHGEFLKVKSKTIEGWVSQKSIINPDDPSTPA